ncbi:DUF2637 domain-containing protein [Virgisporangium aurantiacum]|uniref:DUF2637 domain-containing protein n=1 Tax=Virgisporangium aurantiacum TaxID=175570 RepID=A0A8J3ZMM2_9ACTN|nr:DUF2637 domain-containing protein [Virgisporangium aurantiacum]GIJ64373.1 hypothetical protein Vau01_118890 [Virgisporangium aurantiacum]
MEPTPRHGVADKATRIVAVVTVSGLAALAGWISYHHMLLLARRSGQTGVDAHAFPLTVDGLDLIGVLVLLADRRTGRRSGWLPWTVLSVGTIASISANIAVAPDNLVARAISGWSAVALLAAAKMLAHLFEPAEPAHRHPLPVTVTPDPSSSQISELPASEPPPDGATPVGDREWRLNNGNAAGRVPTTPAAYARWCAIWAATRDLPAATRDVARAHGVSLRTLQFIRSAGEAGQLTPPPPDRPDPVSAGPAEHAQRDLADPVGPEPDPQPDLTRQPV